MNSALPAYTVKIFTAVLIISLMAIMPWTGVGAEDNGEEEMRDPFEIIYTPEEEEEEVEEVEVEEPEEEVEADMTDQVFALTTNIIETFEEDYTAEEIAESVLAAVEVNVDENRLRELIKGYISEEDVPAEVAEVEIEEETEYIDPKLAAPDEVTVDDPEEVDVEVEEPVPEIFAEEEEPETLEELVERDADVEREVRDEPGERGREILDRFLQRDVEEPEDPDAEEIEEVDEVEPQTLLQKLRAEPEEPEAAEDLGGFVARLVGEEVDLTREPGEAAAEVMERLDEIEPRKNLEEMLESILSEETSVTSSIIRQQIFRREMRARPEWSGTYEFTFTVEEEISTEELKELYGIETDEISKQDVGEVYEYELLLPADMIYEVGPGETVEDISRQSGIPVYQILRASRLKAEEIETGSILVLPYDM